MADSIDFFWKLFDAVAGKSDTGITTVLDSLAKSDRAKLEDYFLNVIDQSSFNTEDYNKLRKLLIDLFATHRTLASQSISSTDPHSLMNSDLDELFRSFGYPHSTQLRGIDENPLDQKVNFFLDLVNLYKVKGTPQSLLEVLQYYGVTKLDIYEFVLKLFNDSDTLIFDGKVVTGTSITQPTLQIPYNNLTENDPHWLYTKQQILDLNNTNKINLPSQSPYLGIQPIIDLDGVEFSIISRIVQDQYQSWKNTYMLPPANAEITYIGEIKSLLELYLSVIYMFNKFLPTGKDQDPCNFLCYDGTSVDYIEILNKFDELSTPPIRRCDLNTSVPPLPTDSTSGVIVPNGYCTDSKLTEFYDTFTRDSSSNFLVSIDSAGEILSIINPILKNDLDNVGNPIETLYSLLKDLANWVRTNIGYGFVNFGFILFGINEFFKTLNPVIEFFKPYRTRLLLLESLQIKNKLFNTIKIDDDFHVNTKLFFQDFITGDGIPCCIDSSISDSICISDTQHIRNNVIKDYITFDSPQTDTNYIINATLRNSSGTGSIYNFVVTKKELNRFELTFSGVIDSDTYYIDWYITNSNHSGIESLFLNDRIKTIYLNEECSSPNYTISTIVKNLIDIDPSLYSCTVIDKQVDRFTIKLSGLIDSNNYSLEWMVCEGDVDGIYNIPSGVSEITVPLPPDIYNDRYPLLVTICSDTTDSSIYSLYITEKNQTDFTVKFSGEIDNIGNYYLSWTIPYNIDSIEYSPNWKGLWVSNADYIINDLVVSGTVSESHYICIQNHTANNDATKPGSGSNWTSMWKLYSEILCAELTDTNISVYSRETFDCGSYFDIGVATDISDEIFIEAHDVHRDHLRCPINSSAFVASDIFDFEYISYSQQVEFGVNNIFVRFQYPQVNTNYIINATLRNASGLESIYNFIITNKETYGFEVLFSGLIDSNDYYIDWYLTYTNHSGVTDLFTGDIIKTIYLNEACPDSTNYTVSAIIKNDIDSNPFIYAWSIIDKQFDRFSIKFSSAIVSDNYSVEWIVCEGAAEGIFNIPSGVSEVTITLPSIIDHVSYPLLVTMCSDSTDSSIYSMIIIDKNSTYFTVKFSGIIDAIGNYCLSWIIPYNIQQYFCYHYYQTGGFRDLDSEGTFDCTHGFDLIDIKTESVTNYLLQENGGYLLQENDNRILL